MINYKILNAHIIIKGSGVLAMKLEKIFSSELLLGAMCTLIDKILCNLPIINSKLHTTY